MASTRAAATDCLFVLPDGKVLEEVETIRETPLLTMTPAAQAVPALINLPEPVLTILRKFNNRISDTAFSAYLHHALLAYGNDMHEKLCSLGSYQFKDPVTQQPMQTAYTAACGFRPVVMLYYDSNEQDPMPGKLQLKFCHAYASLADAKASGFPYYAYINIGSSSAVGVVHTIWLDADHIGYKRYMFDEGMRPDANDADPVMCMTIIIDSLRTMRPIVTTKGMYLGSCSQCGKPSSEDTKLKRCIGCSLSALYCSDKCQKQHWGSHKLMCKSKERMRLVMPLPGHTRLNNQGDLIV
jgi:hypothetical protein